MTTEDIARWEGEYPHLKYNPKVMLGDINGVQIRGAWEERPETEQARLAARTPKKDEGETDPAHFRDEWNRFVPLLQALRAFVGPFPIVPLPDGSTGNPAACAAANFKIAARIFKDAPQPDGMGVTRPPLISIPEQRYVLERCFATLSAIDDWFLTMKEQNDG